MIVLLWCYVVSGRGEWKRGEDKRASGGLSRRAARKQEAREAREAREATVQIEGTFDT
jgi:hypothetical protein